MAERISFTRPSAERIARAVRVVENTRPGGAALGFRRQMLEAARVVKLATFQGPWPRDSVNIITFKGSDRTAEAANLFFPVPDTQMRDCAVAKIGTAWHLIDVPFYTATAVFARGTASGTFFGTGSTSTIRFIGTGSTSQLSFISAVSTTTGTISFLKGVSASLNTANCTITVTPDQGTATFVASISQTTGTAVSVSMSGTQTAISVSMSGTQTVTVLTSTFTAAFLTLEVR
jgi:hypothetical protein